MKNKQYIFKVVNIFFLISIILFSCISKTDVYDAEIDNLQVSIKRFDKDLFSLSSQNTNVLNPLQHKYPHFANEFFINILGLNVFPGNEKDVDNKIKKFTKSYAELKDTVNTYYKDLADIEAEFEVGFKNLKRINRKYKIPEVIAFIGPIDAVFDSWQGQTVDVIMDSVVGISLLGHLGDNLTIKNKRIMEDLYPSYITRKFSKIAIVASCFKNIVEDLYHDKSATKNLLNQIVEKGRLLYLVKKLLPDLNDTLLFSYTEQQLSICKNQEQMIWKLLLTNNNLYSKDFQVIRNFIGEAPFTKGLSHDFPGYTGLFIGYQIVSSYMEKYPDKKIADLMKMNTEKLFQKSDYKPHK